MITDEIINAILASLSSLYLWASTTIALDALGFQFTFFEIWTSNAIALAITDLFLFTFRIFDMPDDSGQEE